MNKSEEITNNEPMKNERELKVEINKHIAENLSINKEENIVNLDQPIDQIKIEGEINEKPKTPEGPKEKKISFEKSYILQKLKESNISEDLLKDVNLTIDSCKIEIYDNIVNNVINFGKEKKSVEEIILKKEDKNKNRDINIIEENLRIQKLKDIKDNKDNIEHKIKSLEENIKILENNENTRLDLNVSIGGKDVIDDNIRKSRIKEIKTKKEILENKLVYLDVQVQNLMREEESNNSAKKFNLKQYLDNFEKDKKEAELREQRWKKDHEQRVKAFEEQKKKLEEKLRDKTENDYNSYNLKKQENYLKKLELIKQNNKVHHDDVKKISELKEEWKAKPIVDKQYLFKIAEEEYKKKEQILKDEDKKKLETELAKIKQNYKSITKDQIEEFKKNYQDKKQKLLYEKDKERLLKKEELIQKNINLPKGETQIHQKIVEEEKKNREFKEKEKMDKIYAQLKIKQFSKVIQTNMIPKVDETKKKEIEERIHAEGQRPKKIENKRTGRIILKKPDPSHPKKYNWELKLNTSNISDGGRNNNNISISRGILSSSILNKSRPYTGEESNFKSSHSRSKDKKIPLEKNPDYLTEMRVKRHTMDRQANNTNPQLRPVSDKKWKKMINNNKYSLIENVEQIKMKANLLEQQAKMKERLLHLNGGTQKNPEIGEDVSNMLIDAIKAKLTILENISTKKR